MVLNKVLITGASGLLGQHFVLQCIKQEIKTIGLCRREPTPNLVDQWLEFDLENFETIPEDLDIDAVVHCAAYLPSTESAEEKSKIKLINVDATKKIGDYCLRKKLPLLYISGAIVYENEADIAIKESAPLRTKSAWGGEYALSKLAGEQALISLQNKGLDLAILRPTSLYGTGLGIEKLLSKLLIKCGKGEEINPKPPLSNSINFIHARDVAQAGLELIKKGGWDVFNIGSSECYNIIEIVKKCIEAVGEGSIVIPNQNEDTATFRYDVNSDKLYTKLGFRASISLTEGLSLMHLGSF